MKKKNKKKTYIIIFLSLIILLGISLFIDRKTGKIERVLKSFTTIAQQVAIYPFTALNNDKNNNQKHNINCVI